jgi:hypothetical protein
VGFWLGEGGFWFRVKVGLGQAGVLARWGWLLVQGVVGFGPGWGFD